MLNVLLAPSGAGKTHWLKTHSWFKGFLLVDGDKIKAVAKLYSKLGQEFGPKWFEGEGARKRLDEKDVRFARLATQLKRDLHVAPYMMIFTAEFSIAREADHCTVCVPGFNVYKANMSTRSPDSGQPIMPDEVIKHHIELYRGYAKVLKTISCSRMGDAVEDLRMRANRASSEFVYNEVYK